MKTNMSPKIVKAIAVAGVASLIAIAAATPGQARWGGNAAAAGAGFAAGAVVGSAAANNAAYGYGPGYYGPGYGAYAYAPGYAEPGIRSYQPACSGDLGYGRADYSSC
jgi:hypothetical protein